MRLSFPTPAGLPAAGLLVALFAGTAPAATVSGDKSIYTLANPTPASLLRELTTDRPDVTESPFTVDAGHLQLEMDAVNYTHNRLDGVKTAALGLAPFNLRLGVRNNFELGVFISPYLHVAETPRGGPRTTTSGIGDTTLRAKLNFWGNDGGETAFGVFVDLTLPTAKDGLGNDKVEGALALPVAFELPGGWEGGAMTVLEMHRSAGSSGYRAGWSNTLTIGHDLAKSLSGYVELTSAAGDGPHVATFDVGLAWKLDPNTQLDTGMNIGLSRLADDVLVFAGVSRRF